MPAFASVLSSSSVIPELQFQIDQAIATLPPAHRRPPLKHSSGSAGVRARDSLCLTLSLIPNSWSCPKRQAYHRQMRVGQTALQTPTPTIPTQGLTALAVCANPLVAITKKKFQLTLTTLLTAIRIPKSGMKDQ